MWEVGVCQTVAAAALIFHTLRQDIYSPVRCHCCNTAWRCLRTVQTADCVPHGHNRVAAVP